MRTELILIVEDDAEIADIVRAYLEKDGFRVLYACNGMIALDYYREYNPSLIVLDIRMPEMDGWEVLTNLRREGNTPVIMLTANDEDSDKLSALRIGADDYVVKPFNPAEIVARTHAILRRSRLASIEGERKSYKISALELFPKEHSVVLLHSNKDIGSTLTTTEFKLLSHMIRHPRRVFSRQELMDACLGESDTLERTVDSHISKLRKKLEAAGVAGIPESIRGFGYRLGN